MGCPACCTDYVGIERRIDNGEFVDADLLLRALEAEELFLTGGMVVYCPSCIETIERLKERVASKLRKDTVSNIKVLLDQAYDAREQTE
ncbi:MAG: hypothetical protein U9N45_00040 [Gemmatimonadota bacterium]|nr:hypothetical protein [Gemmatimonadota bacterium]